ncbi:Uncharacterised protein [Rhodococcus gordoniae]|uniref:HNH endonuclease n=1 Tax=Rhodococcus gordoniae TaxID=223392 RepID=A0A379M1R9_9NOCA|nr:hypothetical protein [Rhodococcus gordoniae]SUE16251.1 Uncharacterised protein [Rhodococcus gordoniae]
MASRTTRPRDSVIKRLYALSMNRCAFPECTTEIVETGTGTVVSEVCHINAHSVGGPRYDAGQTDEERQGFDNLIIMCKVHHAVVDDENNLDRFTTEYLHNLKREHETAARQAPRPPEPEGLLTALQLSAAFYESGSTHMDFRNAIFKVGGEGGYAGGGGGNGGMLTIVGIARLPEGVDVNLDGGHGRWPGGGGGGGGILRFQGRPADTGDVTSGLSVRAFFTADAARISEGLLFTLGSGPSYFGVESFPASFVTEWVAMVDFGSIAANTLLQLRIEADSEEGHAEADGTLDAEVPDWEDAIVRRSLVGRVSLTVSRPGIVNLPSCTRLVCQL